MSDDGTYSVSQVVQRCLCQKTCKLTMKLIDLLPSTIDILPMSINLQFLDHLTYTKIDKHCCVNVHFWEVWRDTTFLNRFAQSRRYGLNYTLGRLVCTFKDTGRLIDKDVLNFLTIDFFSVLLSFETFRNIFS